MKIKGDPSKFEPPPIYFDGQSEKRFILMGNYLMLCWAVIENPPNRSSLLNLTVDLTLNIAYFIKDACKIIVMCSESSDMVILSIAFSVSNSILHFIRFSTN